MFEFPYYVLLSLAFVWALVDWRRGLYLCLLFDVIRDPVRKLADDQPVIVTVAAAALWLAVFVGAYGALGPRFFSIVRQIRPLRAGINLLLLAIIPAALVSIVSYSGGWKVAGVGFASYTLPILGMLVGSHYLRSMHDLWRLFGFYCIVNGFALIGSLFEFLKSDLPALGGINMVWLRYQTGYTVELICGYYRSPDVMGLHAANVAMFGSLLSLQRQSRWRWLWFGLVIWGSFCLLLSGRRKMIGMMFVFAFVYIALRLRRSGVNRVIPFVMILVSIATTIFLLTRQVEETQDYYEYAQTTITQGTERLNQNVVGGVIWSVRQSGILGYGLGTATQGRYYAEKELGIYTWQEDGVSRVFAEMGLIGALLVILSAGFVLQACWLAFKMVPSMSSVREVQIGLTAIIAASAASFVVSHQAFSGDPCSLLLVSLLLGALLSGPIQVVKQIIAAERLAELLEDEQEEEADPLLAVHGNGPPY